MYYIGGTSESADQVVIYSYSMAYGGGGFAVSYPLAAELVKILDGCIDRYDQLYGSDQRIQASHMTAWVRINGLNVEYFRYDVMEKIGNLIGTTIKLITVRKLEATFQTWSSKLGIFTLNTRSVILDSFERGGEDVTATTYKRHKSIAEINCGKCHCRPALAVKVFNVTAAKLSPELWDKAPRRQCCQIINGTQGGGVVDSYNSSLIRR
ncbi:unnamed protein product [Prunus brigantina]